MNEKTPPRPWKWLQIKGDPSVRAFLFQQQRVESLFDAHIEQLHSLVVELLTNKGIFHAKLHYSSSQLTCWSCDDPYRYRVFVHEEVIGGTLLEELPDQPLRDLLKQRPALLGRAEIETALEEFKRLRLTDETVYLRNASINCFNGIIGMTFSCDGAHYLSHAEFMEKLKEFGNS